VLQSDFAEGSSGWPARFLIVLTEAGAIRPVQLAGGDDVKIICRNELPQSGRVRWRLANDLRSGCQAANNVSQEAQQKWRSVSFDRLYSRGASYRYASVDANHAASEQYDGIN